MAERLAKSTVSQSFELGLGEKLLGVNLSYFSEAKDPQHPEQNEDIFTYNDYTFVLADGSTSKSYDPEVEAKFGKSGGRVAAELVSLAAQQTASNGIELVQHVSNQLSELYTADYPGALEDSKLRFATTLLAARIIGNQLFITQVGDSGFRVNGKEVYTEERLIDKLDAQARAQAINAALAAGQDETTALRFGRVYIDPLLNQQYQYRNNPDHWLGFAYIDGSPVPAKFIKTYTFPIEDLRTLEFFSDGYATCPNTVSVGAWEELAANIQLQDPLRYKKYPATKLADDRTIAVIEFTQ